MGVDSKFERGEGVLDISNVFVIIGRNWTKDKVIDEIVAEKYKHNFLFSHGSNDDVLLDKMRFADEVWVFGDCEHSGLYEYAVEDGMDIWEMG